MSLFELSFPTVLGGAAGRAIFKGRPEHFKVFEQLKFMPQGSGEHVFLLLEQQSHNTLWVCRLLAKYAGVELKDVGYAGQKDRHGVTRQWFSIYYPGRCIDSDKISTFLQEHQILLLTHTHHNKKLRVGALAGNHFEVRLTHFSGCYNAFEQRAAALCQYGFPNWFGEQRFGRDCSNLDLAVVWLKPDSTIHKLKRDSRSYAISSARSWLFNQVLKERVKTGCWNQLIEGDVLIFKDSQSLILPDRMDESAENKWQQGELHPSGPLWGQGELLSRAKAQALELAVAEKYTVLSQGLTRKGKVLQDRRALRQWVKDLKWQWDGDDVVLTFFLPKGSYATAMLKELVDYTVQIEGVS